MRGGEGPKQGSNVYVLSQHPLELDYEFVSVQFYKAESGTGRVKRHCTSNLDVLLVPSYAPSDVHFLGGGRCCQEMRGGYL